jgi:hypothetical protein
MATSFFKFAITNDGLKELCGAGKIHTRPWRNQKGRHRPRGISHRREKFTKQRAALSEDSI